MGISLKAKQRFRQRLHNIEDADEIIDALNEFVDRFTLIGGNFSSSNWETVHELNLDNLQTIMVTFSVLGRESIPKQAGFKRTAVFYKEKDLAKYQKRAAVKDLIISEMATENMSRVRAGIWTVSDLINLTQDPTLKLVLDDISTLSFELAAQKLQTANNPLLTSDIKNKWILKLRGHFYNE